MGTVISNLKAKFSVESSDVKKGLKPGEDALLDLDRKVEKSILGLKNMFTPLALLGAAGGAFAILKEAIGSIEGPGDKFEAAMGGIKEATFEAGKALATMNFTDFFSNLQEGYDRGKEFTEMLDQLADKVSYNDYRIAQLKQESETLQEIIKDKTKELSVRADAAEKVKEIEEKIMERKKALAVQEFEIMKGQWQERNKMEASEAVKLYETIDNMGPELQKRLQKAFEGAKSYQLGSVKKGIQSVLFGLYDPQLVKEVDKETLESYAQFFKLMEEGEKDVLIKLFNTFKDIDKVGYEAQREYNGIVRITTGLLNQEGQALKDVKKTTEELAAAQKVLEDLKSQEKGISKVPTNNLLFPDFNQISSNILVPFQAVQTSMQGMKDTMTDVTSVFTDAFTNVTVGFSEMAGNLWAGGEGMRGWGIQLVGNTFGDMLINLGKVAIAAGIGIEAIKAAFASLGGVGAIVAGGMLIALGSAIKATISATFAASPASTTTDTGSKYIYDGRTATSQSFKISGQVEVVARGSDLVGVIDIENLRKDIST